MDKLDITRAFQIALTLQIFSVGLLCALHSPAKVCNENILTKKDEERNISVLYEECMVD